MTVLGAHCGTSERDGRRLDGERLSIGKVGSAVGPCAPKMVSAFRPSDVQRTTIRPTPGSFLRSNEVYFASKDTSSRSLRAATAGWANGRGSTNLLTLRAGRDQGATNTFTVKFIAVGLPVPFSKNKRVSK